jgi:hypothetical protein
VNVPVGVAAVIAGRYLLPRTRQFSRPGRFDGPGTALLVAWTTALLLALFAASGLSLPPWPTGLFAILALAGAIVFVRRETRILHPLIPVWLLRSRPVALGLAGAGCGYFALLGDLVLPRRWGDRRRGLAGALLACAAMVSAMVIPLNPATVIPPLALAGAG